jgi:hypothetical protein
MHIRILLNFLFLTVVTTLHANEYAVDTIVNNTSLKDDLFFEKKAKKLKQKYASLSKGMNKANKAIVQKLHKIEKDIRKRISNADSSLFHSFIKEYTISLSEAKTVSSGLHSLNYYLPSLDSLATGLRFLGKNDALLGEQLQAVQLAWNKTTSVQEMLNRQSKVWEQKLLELGMVKEMSKVRKLVFYHRQQLQQYRSLLQDPDRIVHQLMGHLRNNPSFAAFMNTNSLLAQLFPIPGRGTAEALARLQTRVAIQQSLTSQIQSGGITDPSQFLEQQFQTATVELNKLKDKMNQLGGGSDFSIPDFTPNQQKTKSFWKRLEFGINIQSQRPNGLLPITTDIGFSTGYKLNDQLVTGIGMAYKMGWGNRISNLRLSHQGIGLRSYVDIKAKGSIWISGGYEWNYQAAFSSIVDLKDNSAWQRSALIGCSKKFSIGKKKGKAQLLWDFLSYRQMPVTPALKFRIEYQL